MNDQLGWWEKVPLALATAAQSVVVGQWYYRSVDFGAWELNIAVAVIAGLALDLIVVTTVMGRRLGRDSRWSNGAAFGAFVCSALIAVDTYSDWLVLIRPLLHVSYPAMVLLYSQHLAGSSKVVAAKQHHITGAAQMITTEPQAERRSPLEGIDVAALVAQHGGNLTKAAQAVNVSRQAISAKLKGQNA